MSEHPPEGDQPQQTPPEPQPPEVQPEEVQPEEPQHDITPHEATTPGGYSYTVVSDDEQAERPPKPPREPGRGVSPLWLLVAAVVPAAIVGLGVWFFLGRDGGGDDARLHANVASVLGVFSQGDAGAVSVTRYEGELPPGIPDVPKYDGAEVVSAVEQRAGTDIAYIVIYDTGDSREDVAEFYDGALDADPWQISGGSDDAESTAKQFRNIEAPDINGVVLIAESKNGDHTTILESVRVSAGDAGSDGEAFEPPESRPLPEGYPGEIPAYEGATLIETAFNVESGSKQYAVSYVTDAGASDVIAFYREALESAGLKPVDARPASSPRLTVPRA